MNLRRTDERHEHHLHGLRHLEAHAHGKHHVLHDVMDAAMVLLTLALVIYLWPASLGGRTHFVVVQGHSMEPTFHLGDVVIARTNDDPKVGQIIVYQIPKGTPGAGMLIIHRVKSVWPDGTLQTQGDNRTEPDPFHITAADVMGTPVRAIPHLGRLIGLSSSPLVVALAAGMLTIFVLWPDEREHKVARRRRRAARRAERKAGGEAEPSTTTTATTTATTGTTTTSATAGGGAKRHTPATLVAARLQAENDAVELLTAVDVEQAAQQWLDEQLASLSFD